MRAITTRAATALLVMAVLASCGVGSDDDPPAEVEPTVASTTVPPAGDHATTSTTERPAGAPTDPRPEAVAVVPPDVPPAVAGSVDGLVGQIVEAERAVRDPATPVRRLARQAHRQQVAYRELALRPSWLHPVLDALPADLKDDALAQVAARQEFLDMQTQLQDGPPAWEIRAPAPAADLLRWYQGAGDTYDVEWEVLAAINLVETGMGRVRADSVAGAQGPMQFIPETWARWGHGDVRDPRHAIYGAARYLASSGAADGRVDDAIFAYNNHNNYVRAVQRYAGIMRDDPQVFQAFYYWQVYYRTDVGDLLLPEGYPQVPAVAR